MSIALLRVGASAETKTTPSSARSKRCSVADGLGLEQIELLARERQDRHLLGCQARADRAADESAGADDHDAAW